MPDAFTYPGVYVQELPSSVHTISGVSTSVAAFVDRFARGPLNAAVQVTSFAAFQNVFGGLASNSAASYGIQQFFLNGGTTAWIVRISGATAPTTASVILKKGGTGGTAVLTVNASSPGGWATNALQVVPTVVASDATRFNLLVQLLGASGSNVVASESYTSLSMNPSDPNYAPSVVNAGSRLVQLVDDEMSPTGPPDLVTPDKVKGVAGLWVSLTGGTETSAPTLTSLSGDLATTGIYALDRIAPSIFNLLCVPLIATFSASDYAAAASTLAAFCAARRAFLILDAPPGAVDEPTMMSTFLAADVASANAAVYFPNLVMPDLANGGRSITVGASGTVAGIYAATDASRGVWKAPAGVNATVAGASVAVNITDGEQGLLNPLGINAIRTFPLFGTLVWGARTLNGADALASPWKYVPVRRTALYIEQSLYEGLRWAVFEPNDETLWAQIRSSVDDFMSELFRSGAFQGGTPSQAYLVKCDATTTTQGDIDRGIVNILVGFAPLKPAEFVVLQIEQLAGQSS